MSLFKGQSSSGEILKKTAFGEVLVGQLSPQFQGSFEYTVDNTDLNTNTVANSGTVTQASGMGIVTTSTTTASTALFESKQHARYKSGLGGVSRFTALFTTPVATTEQYIGLADEVGSSATFKNGYVIGYDGTTFGFHRFQNDIKFTVDLADWDDPLDGSGISGIIIDQTKLNIFFIQYQYLGAGAIKVWYEKPNGDIIKVHTIEYANTNTEPSTHNPNFHHIMWVNNKATTDNLILKSSSYAYFVEGKTSFVELHQPENASGAKEKTSVTTEVAIFTIRNKATYASKTNFIDIVLLGAGASIEASSDIAKEKGSFPAYVRDKYMDSKFIARLDPDVRDLIAKHGIRNSHLLSVAPTGTISLSADNVSSGIEPVFSLGYDRTIQTFDGPKVERVDDYGYREFGVEGKIRKITYLMPFFSNN